MQDLKINLTKVELMNALGRENVSILDALFAGEGGHEYDEILIRRC